MGLQMDQIFIGYYFITFVIGVFCLGSFFTLIRNNNNEIIKLYLVCYLTFTLLILSILLRNYFNLLLQKESMGIIVLQFFGIISFVYMLSFLVNKLFLVPFTSVSNKIFLIISIFTFVVCVIKEFFVDSFLEYPFITLIEDEHLYLLFFIYIIIIYVLYRNNIQSKQVGKILKVTFFITLLIIPGILYDEYFHPGGLKIIMTPLFFLFISSYSLISFFKFNYSIQHVKFDISNEFRQKYGITDRETEVIELLIKGFSYNKIANELFISISTVRTHVSSIYKKMRINSRYELINLIT